MNYESIVCMHCLPPEHHHRAKQLRGFWDVDYTEKIARCANCGFERPFVERKKRNDYITPSQQKAIDRIEHFFKDWRQWDNAYKHDTLHKFEVELTDYGTVFVSVEDVENYLICEGGFFSIGRRGALKVHTRYGLLSDSRDHYAKMLGGTVA